MKNSEQIKEETEKLRLDIEKTHIEARDLLKKGMTMYILENLVLNMGKILNNRDIDTSKLTKETNKDLDLLLKECVHDAVTMANKLIDEVLEKRKKGNG